MIDYHRQARILLLTIAGMYGTNYGSVKILEESLDPSVASFFRFLLASSVFLPNVLNELKSNSDVVKSGLFIGSINALGYIAQAKALETASASTVAFICSMFVIVVPILNLIFRSSSSSKDISQLYPSLMAVAGIACIESGAASGVQIGDIIAILQPILFGYSYWKTGEVVKEFNSPNEAYAFTGSTVLAVAVISFLWMSADFVLPSLIQGGFEALRSDSIAQLQQVSSPVVVAAIVWTGNNTIIRLINNKKRCMTILC